MAGPLSGIKVIEMGGIGPGPVAGMMLADMGADVIKVEPPNGDDARAWAMRATGCSGPNSSHFKRRGRGDQRPGFC